MLEKLRHSNLLFWSLEILIVVAIIWILTKVGFIFRPVGVFISVVFVPLLVAGFLFYMLNPIVKLIMRIHIKKFKINRSWASLIVIALLIGLIVLGVISLIPQLTKQVTQLIANVPHIAKQSQITVTHYMSHSKILQNDDVAKYLKSFEGSLATWSQAFIGSLTNSLGSVISMITDVTIMAITVPVILFYMLRDGHKLIPALKRFLPNKRQDRIVDLLHKMGETISQYIGGQVIECLFVGFFTSIGYMIIGMPFGLLLGIIAGLCNIIPYVGPYIGITPALIVALIAAPQKLLWVIVVVIVVQQIDGNIIYPNIIGRSLKIHPLTIIILLLAAGHIAGIPGMILVIPFYAVLRTVVQYFWNILQLQDENQD
ncbi:AI-2E family transporter [Furfurilactobacillus cerevisiae]|uniref:AI-2E family transporter n=1 Tax=Furfurilactobacillus rossiae TaxID=231049 RepID=UPI003B986A87